MGSGGSGFMVFLPAWLAFLVAFPDALLWWLGGGNGTPTPLPPPGAGSPGGRPLDCGVYGYLGG